MPEQESISPKRSGLLLREGLVLCVAESESVAAPVIPSIRVTEEKDAGARINFPEEKRTAAAGERSSRRGKQALLKIVDATSKESQCDQAGVKKCRGVEALLTIEDISIDKPFLESLN